MNKVRLPCVLSMPKMFPMWFWSHLHLNLLAAKKQTDSMYENKICLNSFRIFSPLYFTFTTRQKIWNKMSPPFSLFLWAHFLTKTEHEAKGFTPWCMNSFVVNFPFAYVVIRNDNEVQCNSFLLQQISPQLFAAT